MQEKIDLIKKIFSTDKSEKEIYEEIIEFGKKSSLFPQNELIKTNLVRGCQSLLYLTHTFENEKIFFYIHSDALISKGLAQLLVFIYSAQEPKQLFTAPPTFLKDLKVIEKISMNRQIGISNLFDSMLVLASKYI